MPHHPAAPTTLDALRAFKFARIINDDPVAHTLALLGQFPNSQSNELVDAVVIVARTALDPRTASTLLEDLVHKMKLEQSTDIYTWLFAWLGEGRESDVKINIICPATEVHIRKYSRQKLLLVRETPELYESIVKPYILAFPASRTQWAENILLGTSEASKILHKSSDFLLLPDMKWDLKTLSSLYLLALVQDRSIRSLRDLRKLHVPLLRSIRKEAIHVVSQRWPEVQSLRMFIHYQPSYYHFHVHIVNADCPPTLGMSVGQAHLLDDVISLLEVDVDQGPSIFERMTLSYTLGDQHGLYDGMSRAQTKKLL